jgi:hypothetical protein
VAKLRCPALGVLTRKPKAVGVVSGVVLEGSVIVSGVVLKVSVSTQ